MKKHLTLETPVVLSGMHRIKTSTELMMERFDKDYAEMDMHMHRQPMDVSALVAAKERFIAAAYGVAMIRQLDAKALVEMEAGR